jgi:RNA polymerase sigma-32 factor
MAGRRKKEPPQGEPPPRGPVVRPATRVSKPTRTKAARPARAEEGTEAAPEEAEPEVVDAEPLEEEPEPAELEQLEGEIVDVGRPPTALALPEEQGLQRRDPMQVYMAEVHRHPLLSREDEHRLAVLYRETGDVKAAYRLVASNLRLVVKLAYEYHRNPLALLDLIQEGNIGLMQAVKKYDPTRGVKLSSYAAWWIRAYILRYIMDNWKMVKLGTTEAQRKLFFKLRQEQERLTHQGFEVTPKLLAERLNVTEQDIVEMDQRLGHDELSLDAPMSEDSQATRLDRMLPSSGQAQDERLGNEELKLLFRTRLAEFSQALADKERFIFEKRLMSDEPLTLQEIGDQYGVSRERARQIEAALIGKIKDYMRAHIPDFDLVAAPKD